LRKALFGRPKDQSDTRIAKCDVPIVRCDDWRVSCGIANTARKPRPRQIHPPPGWLGPAFRSSSAALPNRFFPMGQSCFNNRRDRLLSGPTKPPHISLTARTPLLDLGPMSASPLTPTEKSFSNHPSCSPRPSLVLWLRPRLCRVFPCAKRGHRPIHAPRPCDER